MSKSFSEVVKSVVDQVKTTKGGVKKLIEATGKSAGLITHWKTGRYIPTLRVQVEFITKSNNLIQELRKEEKDNLEKYEEISNSITA
ncbi:hypothetical protein [Dyadobacter sp. CY312]|uniref:hypothetical protein n=1 Tax=Dyadobacter sp. CY312 TaxID=2907303 RepID=UPI001F2AA9B5|nr:hypothetical protein [Dyadobacter sp. CY312]MCE7039289.1 hypothetical protein [Dyadobacter sp. CY312]